MKDGAYAHTYPRAIRIALILLAIAGAVLAFRQTWAEFLIDQPAIAASVLPAPVPEVPAATLHRSLRGNGLSPLGTQPTEAEVLAINRSLPLHPYPYVWKATQFLAAEDRLNAIAALERARKASPQAYPVRRLLAENYLLTGQADAAIVEMFTAAELLDNVAPEFVSALVLAGRTPELRRRIEQAVDRQPEWVSTYFANLPAELSDEPMTIAMGSRSDVSASQRARLVNRLARNGNPASAYRVWSADPDVSDEASSAQIYDAQFKGLPGSPPFNWQIRDDEFSRAQIGGGRLEAMYFGGRDSIITAQTLRLPAGRYDWAIPYSRQSTHDEKLRMEWQISCVGGNVTLARVDIAPDDGDRGTARIRFAVPAQDCATQELRLRGLSRRSGDRLVIQFEAIRTEGGGS